MGTLSPETVAYLFRAVRRDADLEPGPARQALRELQSRAHATEPIQFYQTTSVDPRFADFEAWTIGPANDQIYLATRVSSEVSLGLHALHLAASSPGTPVHLGPLDPGPVSDRPDLTRQGWSRVLNRAREAVRERGASHAAFLNRINRRGDHLIYRPSPEDPRIVTEPD